MALARAYAAQGNSDASRKEYEGFLELWKYGDADAPILKRRFILDVGPVFDPSSVTARQIEQG